jgi:peptide/nickel transport system permease protein
MRAGEQVTEAIRAHHGVSQRVAEARALELFRRVGIADPERRLAAFPHEMSGGMRQRVMIAMALANRPALLIADEPTTALDVTVQAQILDLLAELKRETVTALIFITHSLAVVAEIADRVVVMYAGQIVEQGPVSAVFAHALHPYTMELLTAVPEGDSLPVGIPGVVPQPHDYPPGCRFAPRCRHTVTACTAAVPALDEARHGRQVRCIRWTELAEKPEAIA